MLTAFSISFRNASPVTIEDVENFPTHLWQVFFFDLFVDFVLLQ